MLLRTLEGVVVNLSPHLSIKVCKSGSRGLQNREVSGTFSEPFRFAVPRLMEWAPHEYERIAETSQTEVFDLTSRSVSENHGFRPNSMALRLGIQGRLPSE